MKTPALPLRLLTLALCALAPLAATAFELQGHRGARGLAPENTLAAFSQALAVGVDTLELDIGLTADGVVVISHDPYLNPALARTADGQWLKGTPPVIHSLTFAELQKYDVGRIDPQSPYAAQFPAQQQRDGEHVPTLASLFELVKARGANQLGFNIETKIDPARPEQTTSPELMTAALLKVVADAGMRGRVTVQSFDWRSLAVARRLEPGIKTACLSSQSASGNTLADGSWTAGLKLDAFASVPAMVHAAGCFSWSPNHQSLTHELVKQAQLLGLKVVPWTVNDPADMDRLLGWGVDSIISDYPDRLRDLMQKRGLPLPAQYK
jgi:glycerophosphoryl diester phosphodiesterase